MEEIKQKVLDYLPTVGFTALIILGGVLLTLLIT